jgi:hypothetical protein
VLAETTTSAEGVPATNVEGTVLLAGVGSAVGEVAPADPPLRGPAGVLAGTCRGTITETEAPGAIGPVTVQLIGPAGIGPVQPAGSEAISAPTGGV